MGKGIAAAATTYGTEKVREGKGRKVHGTVREGKEKAKESEGEKERGERNI